MAEDFTMCGRGKARGVSTSRWNKRLENDFGLVAVMSGFNIMTNRSVENVWKALQWVKKNKMYYKNLLGPVGLNRPRERIFRCDNCVYSAFDKKTLTRHSKGAHRAPITPNLDHTYLCSYNNCHRSFATRGWLVRHQNERHLNETVDITETITLP